MNVPARGGVKRASKESAGAMMGDSRRGVPAEARHAVEVALELDTVPVNRGGLRGAVHDGDAHRHVASENNRRTHPMQGVRRALGIRLLHDEVIERQRLGAAGSAAHQ